MNCKLEDCPRPKIVCLCGSTKFYDEFLRVNAEETFIGNIVLSVGYFGHHDWIYKKTYDISNIKEHLDELHRRKIDLCDEILVINVGGYIGESTRSEIEYAKKHNKIIRYLENE